MSEHDELWLIYSREYKAFWRPNSAGYTWDIDAAGRYSKEDAESRCEVRDKQPDGGSSEIAVLAPEAAQAIERLEREKEELERRAAFIEHEHPQNLEPHFSAAMGLLTTRRAFRKGEIAQLLAELMQQLAEARAREERMENVIHEYTTHDKDCDTVIGEPCTCGLAEALAAPAPEPSECTKCEGTGNKVTTYLGHDSAPAIDDIDAGGCERCGGTGREPTTSEAERLKQASEILEDTFVPEELIDAKNDLVTWLNKEAAQQQESGE